MRTGFLTSIGPFAALAALAGCGGSSGVSNGFPQPVAGAGKAVGPGVNGGSAMALLTTGRTWQYAVTGTVTKDVLNSTATTSQTISGQVTNATLTREVSSANDGNSNDYQITDTLTYTLQGMAPSVEVSIWNVTQSAADNSVSIMGEQRFNIQAVVDNPAPWVPGTFTTSTNISGLANLSYANLPEITWTINDPTGNGFPVNYNFASGYGTLQTAATDLGQENVPTTTGPSYGAWKSQFSVDEHWVINGAYYVLGMAANGASQPLPPGFIIETKSNRTTVDDWVPSIGASVRSYLTLSETDYPISSYTFSNPSYTTTPSFTYTTGPTLHKTETLELVLTGWK